MHGDFYTFIDESGTKYESEKIIKEINSYNEKLKSTGYKVDIVKDFEGTIYDVTETGEEFTRQVRQIHLDLVNLEDLEDRRPTGLVVYQFTDEHSSYVPYSERVELQEDFKRIEEYINQELNEAIKERGLNPLSLYK